MPQTDIMVTDDMEEGLDLNYIRFNEAKKELSDGNHRRLVIATSTLGGSTYNLPLASGDNVSEFYRRMVFTFAAGSGGTFTFEVPTAERIFFVDNQAGNTITLNSTASTGPNLVNGTKYQLYESTAGVFTVLDSQESTASVNRPFDVAAYLPGGYTVTQQVLKFVYPRTALVGDDFPLSQAHVGTALTGAKSFDVHRNGSSIGTVDFTTASQFATFTSSTVYTFVATDILEIFAPGSTDATGMDFSFTIAGVRT
jgi:hypothetical protein